MARAPTHEPETPMTRDDYLTWVAQQPSGRFERIDGIVVAMAPEKVSHTRCKGAANDALRRVVRQAGLTPCEVFDSGMAVQVEGSDFEPDAAELAGWTSGELPGQVNEQLTSWPPCADQPPTSV